MALLERGEFIYCTREDAARGGAQIWVANKTFAAYQIIRQNGEPQYVVIKSKEEIIDRVNKTSYEYSKRTTYDQYVSDPYSNDFFRRSFEAGLVRENPTTGEKPRPGGKEWDNEEKKKERLKMEGPPGGTWKFKQYWEWDPDATWRIRSTILDDLVRPRRAVAPPLIS